MKEETLDRVEKCVDYVDEILKGGPGSGRKGHKTQARYDPRGDPRAKNKKKTDNPYSEEDDPAPKSDATKDAAAQKKKTAAWREKQKGKKYNPMRR